MINEAGLLTKKAKGHYIMTFRKIIINQISAMLIAGILLKIRISHQLI